MKQKMNKRFTLIELIIVVVTISILAGMALPKFVDIKRQAEHAKLLNNIDAVEKSIAICELEKGDYPIYKDKVDFYSLNDVVQAQILANGETGENLYKVRVNDTSNKTLSGGILSKVFATEDGEVLETEEFHTKLKYGLGKYGINDYYIYSKETGNVYYANGDLLEDSQSEITPICKDGTYYMTVNAGDTAKWIDHIANEYIPDGGSIEYEWAAFDDPGLKKKNDKLNWTTDFDSLPKTQYLKTKITIKSPENGEQTKLLKYRVQYLTEDIEYDEFVLDDSNIKLDNVVKNPDGSYSTTSSSNNRPDSGTNNEGNTNSSNSNSTNSIEKGYIQIEIPKKELEDVDIIINNFENVEYDDIIISKEDLLENKNNIINNGNGFIGGLNNKWNGSYGGSYGSGLSGIGNYISSNVSTSNSCNKIYIYIPVTSNNKVTLPNKIVAVKKDQIEWETIDTLTFECDAMEVTKWVGFDYDGFIPENTRIKVHFSTSDDDTNWSDETESIGSVANSQYIKARIELQKNKYAKQNPTLSEVFFDNETNGKLKRLQGKVYSVTKNENTSNIENNVPTDIKDRFIQIINISWLMDIEQTNDGGYISCGVKKVIKLDKDGNIEWDKDFVDVSKMHSIKQTNDKGYIVCAYSKEGYSLIIKIDSEGNREWDIPLTNNISGYATFVAGTKDGGYVICGYSDGNGDFPKSKGRNDCMILKLDSQGNIEWNKLYGGFGEDKLATIQETKDGGYIACGTTYGEGDFKSSKGADDVLILKLDKNGDMEWNQVYGGRCGDGLNFIQQTKDGGYISCGYTQGLGDFLDLPSNKQNLILKLDSTGKIEWHQSYYNASHSDTFNSIQETKDGGYISCGISDKCGLIVKVDLQGEIIWKKKISGYQSNALYSIKNTSDGGYITCGFTQGGGVFGPALTVYKGSIIKLDKDGEYITK